MGCQDLLTDPYCLRPAAYLADQFPEFDVDCECNRNHAEDDYLKRLKDKNLFEIVGR